MSSSMCWAESLKPIGMPPVARAPRRRSRRKSSSVSQSGKRGGEIAGCALGRGRAPRRSCPSTLSPGQVAAGAGLGALAALEVEGLHLLELVAATSRSAPRRARRSSGSSLPAPRAACRPRPSRCRCRRARRPCASAILASSESAPKLMSETKSGISSRSGLSRVGPDHDARCRPARRRAAAGARAARSRTGCRPSVGSSVRARPSPRPARGAPIFVEAVARPARGSSATCGSSAVPCGVLVERPGRRRGRRAAGGALPRRRSRRASTQTAPSSTQLAELRAAARRCCRR